MWDDGEVTAPGFGDRVRIRETEETRAAGFAGRVGELFGESIPSSSGAGPVIGGRGEDQAFSVFFEETREQLWFAPHLVEFVEDRAGQTMTVDGGPSFIRDPDGDWRQVGGRTDVADFMQPGGSVPRRVSDPFGRIRRWFEKGRK